MSIKYRQVIPAFLDRPPRYMKVVEVGPARNLQAAFLEADILAQQTLGDSFADQCVASNSILSPATVEAITDYTDNPEVPNGGRLLLLTSY